jgi:Fe-S cluster assembly protein SufD
MTTVHSAFTQETFDAFLAGRREPGWLLELRRNAWKTFQALPMPERRQEEWTRTDIRAFHLEKLGPPAPTSDDFSASVPAALLSEGVELAGRTATLDGRLLETSLDAGVARCGVLFGSLDELVLRHSDLVERYLFARAVDPGQDKFAALGAAFWSGGTFLYVPHGVRIERPLHVLSAISPSGVDLGHSLVVLEEGAEATLLAETAGGDAAGGDTPGGFHCGAVEVLVGPRARLRYVNLQNWGTGVWHFAHHKALVGRNAAIQWTIGALGSRLAKVNQHVALVGEGAEAQVNGVMFTDGRQHLSYHTRQHHEVPRCKSDLLYKGALQGNSRIVWRGMIKVDRDAQKTDGYQRDDNLVLSDSARADSIPGLEIEADDVKCTHGATAGRVDDEQVFYAMARGLTRKEAVRMIVAGFFQQVFDRITVPSVRDALGEAIGRRIREYQ